MKRSSIVAVVVATAVIGGGAAAGAAMTGGGSAAEDLRPAAASDDTGERDGGDDDREDNGGDDDRAGDREDDGQDDGQDDDDVDGDDDRDDDGGAGPPSDAGDLARVIATALAAAPGQVVEVDLDADDGERHWDVEIAGDDDRRHEVEISLDGATVLDHERQREGDDDDRDLRAALDEARVTAADAARIAVERLNGRVTDLDLDDDLVWDIELWDADGTGWELEVDIRDGEIRTAERDG
jgi:uncharacterized membrane protein YkoI